MQTPVLAFIGLFFIGLGAYQLATGKLITGGRFRRTTAPFPKPLVYLFSAIEIFAGLSAFAMIGSAMMRSGSLAGSCNLRQTELACSEFHGAGWDAASMGKACGGGTVAHVECADDNLLGRCSFVDGPGKESVTNLYSGAVNRTDGVWIPTKEGQAAECKKRGGTWKPFP